MTMLLPLGHWVPTIDGDPTNSAIYNQHYSSLKSRSRRIARGITQIGGPSERLILATPCRRALFGWRLQRFRADQQTGVECFIFANRGAGLSSDLIIAADAIADRRWPGLRRFTFVDAAKTAQRRSVRARPGECFRQAGWMPCGYSARGLLILEAVVDMRRASVAQP